MQLFKPTCIIIATVFALTAFAQSNQLIFPDLEGEALAEELQSNYKPAKTLSYRQARDLIYAKIDNVNDTVTCVYTGFHVFADPTADISKTIYRRGHRDGINCEHLWPRNKGSLDGLSDSDMHHLFPIRTAVNVARSSLPLGEVDDNKTLRWFYYGAQQQPIPPPALIDLYSELGEERFEPREDFKGNAARALFYFYTIYREEAMRVDPGYFEAQRKDLCRWHEMDPADEREIARTLAIAEHQDGKPNPFVLDPTLAERCYCEGEER
jgi:endonuclease I